MCCTECEIQKPGTREECAPEDVEAEIPMQPYQQSSSAMVVAVVTHAKQFMSEDQIRGVVEETLVRLRATSEIV